MPLEFIKSEKGREMLVHRHFVYTFEREINNKTMWRCEYQIKKKCPGRAHTSNDEVVKLSRREHNHLPDIAKLEARRTVETMKTLAKSSEISSHAVLDKVSSQLPSVVSAQLPPRNSLKRTIQRVRQVKTSFPDEPKTMDFDVPTDFQFTSDGKKFLLYDNHDSKNRISIFSTTENLELMVKCTHWLADGTFSTVPVYFTQLYTIHCVQHSDVMPTAFVLLQNKNEYTYTLMFNALKCLEPRLAPDMMTFDFERTAIRAAKLCFPNVSIRGCHFHMSQSIWRLIKQVGLSRKYIDDLEFALNIRCLSALAYVPTKFVVLYFESLMATKFFIENQNDVAFSDFLNYFESTWIGARDRRLNRKPPFFPIDEWNCFDQLQENIPGTNNSVEEWHNVFSSMFNIIERPNIWKFISALQKQERLNRCKIMQYLSDEKPQQKKKYKDSAVKIVKIAREFSNRNAENYLREISYYLKL